MEEPLLAEAHRELYGLVWPNLQWWASVSFGLLALASFGRKHLNLLTTTGLSVLYVLSRSRYEGFEHFSRA
jgi:hypothetical protein